MPILADELALADLYEKDEVAWLEEMARLAAERQFEEMDCDHLAEFLNDMARRERREVKSRLAILIAHLLKWEFQPEKRTKSWELTILNQRQELADVVDSATLYSHAEDILIAAYERAVKNAAVETELPPSTFPASCPWTVEQLTAETDS